MAGRYDEDGEPLAFAGAPPLRSGPSQQHDDWRFDVPVTIITPMAKILELETEIVRLQLEVGFWRRRCRDIIRYAIPVYAKEKFLALRQQKEQRNGGG